jgi:hypothetical protein
MVELTDPASSRSGEISTDALVRGSVMGGGGILAHGGYARGSVSNHLCGIRSIRDTGLGSNGGVLGGGGIV